MEKQALISKLEEIIMAVKNIPDGEMIEVSNQFGDVVEEAEVLQGQDKKWYLELGENCDED